MGAYRSPPHAKLYIVYYGSLVIRVYKLKSYELHTLFQACRGEYPLNVTIKLEWRRQVAILTNVSQPATSHPWLYPQGSRPTREHLVVRLIDAYPSLTVTINILQYYWGHCKKFFNLFNII